MKQDKRKQKTLTKPNKALGKINALSQNFKNYFKSYIKFKKLKQ